MHHGWVEHEDIHPFILTKILIWGFFAKKITNGIPEASARANMLIAGSIVCIHLLRNFILYLGPRKNKKNLLHWTKWIQMGALTWEKVCQLLHLSSVRRRKGSYMRELACIRGLKKGPTRTKARGTTLPKFLTWIKCLLCLLCLTVIPAHPLV